MAKYNLKEIRNLIEKVNIPIIYGFGIVGILYAINCGFIWVFMTHFSAKNCVQYPLLVSVIVTEITLLGLLMVTGLPKDSNVLAPNLLLITEFIFLFMISLTIIVHLCLKRSISRSEHC
jgi:hypothetical protein